MLTVTCKVAGVDSETFPDDAALQDISNPEVRAQRARLKMPAEPQQVVQRSVRLITDNGAGILRGDAMFKNLTAEQAAAFEKGATVTVTIG
jgi:hypothetical protein